jgi:hypothetical protein
MRSGASISLNCVFWNYEFCSSLETVIFVFLPEHLIPGYSLVYNRTKRMFNEIAIHVCEVMLICICCILMLTADLSQLCALAHQKIDSIGISGEMTAIHFFFDKYMSAAWTTAS